MPKKSCFVSSCTNTSLTPGQIFFSLPRNLERRKKWFAAAGKENVLSGKALYCCSAHFDFPQDATNWMRHKLVEGTVLRLKDDAVPHKNLPTPQLEVKPGCSREPVASTSFEEPPKKVIVVTKQPKNASNPSPKYESSPSLESIPTSSSYTESAVSEDRDSILLEQRQKTTVYLIEKNSRFYLGLPENIYKLTGCLSDKAGVLYRDILITFKKIRLNDVYFRLALDFGISVASVQRIFYSTVIKIANVLQCFLFFPTQMQIKKLLPIPFRYRYSHVSYIIDCFEIEIQKPSNPLFQSQTWSDYYKCNTVKYLVSSTPNGFVNFISNGFGGRITDNNIITASGFLDKIQNVTVMADRGFKHIEHQLLQKGCKLVRPPSVSENTQLCAAEVKTAKRIAALRIHIERIIRRFREFKILSPHSSLNLKMFCIIDAIVIIVAALINVQEPLIK